VELRPRRLCRPHCKVGLLASLLETDTSIHDVSLKKKSKQLSFLNLCSAFNFFHFQILLKFQKKISFELLLTFWILFMFKICSHYKFVWIQILYKFEICSNLNFIPIQNLFPYEICSKLEICSHLKFVPNSKILPNLNFVTDLKFVPNSNLFPFLFKIYLCTSQNCLNRKKEKKPICWAKLLGPFGDRTQVGANRSRNGRGIAAAAQCDAESSRRTPRSRHWAGPISGCFVFWSFFPSLLLCFFFCFPLYFTFYNSNLIIV
jgi:hypothetical protein